MIRPQCRVGQAV